MVVEICFSLSRDLARPRDREVEELYGWEPLKVSHHSPEIGGQCHCGSGNIIVLVCHVISQDQMIIGPCDFMNRSPSS